MDFKEFYEKNKKMLDFDTFENEENPEQVSEILVAAEGYQMMYGPLAIEIIQTDPEDLSEVFIHLNFEEMVHSSEKDENGIPFIPLEEISFYKEVL